MKFRNLLLCSALFGVTVSSAEATPIYRETFHFCTPPGVAPGSIAVEAKSSTGWWALAGGRTEGKPSILKLNIRPATSPLAPVSSTPTGPDDGNVYWSKDTAGAGLTAFTTEVPTDVASISAVTYEQRLDIPKPDPALPEDPNAVPPVIGSKLALLINGTWYIADQVQVQLNNSAWEPVQLNPQTLTYGTVVGDTVTGPTAPMNSGQKLPATGTVSAIGLFFPTTLDKIRFDNFTIHNDSLAPEVSGAIPTQCVQAPQVPTPGVVPTPVTEPITFCALNDGKPGAKYSKRAKDLPAVLKTMRKKTLETKRDKAIAALLLTTKQLASQSLVNVKISDLHFDGKSYHLTVGTQMVTLPRGAARHLSAYLKDLALPETDGSPVFTVLGEKGTKYTRIALCRSQIERIMKKYLAKVTPVRRQVGRR